MSQRMFVNAFGWIVVAAVTVGSVQTGYCAPFSVPDDCRVVKCAHTPNPNRVHPRPPSPVVKPVWVENVKTVSAGSQHNLAVSEDGRLFTWGDNSVGQLGDGGARRSEPALAIGPARWNQVAAGPSFSLAIDREGKVWGWGQLPGASTTGSASTTARPIEVPGKSIAVAAGGQHALVLTENGQLWAWGSNQFGQLGDGTSDARATPVLIGSAFMRIAAGARHSLAVRIDFALLAWGSNDHGQLGLGQTEANTPAKVKGEFVAIAAGRGHSLAIARDGTLWAWGDNVHAQVGKSFTTTVREPVMVHTDRDWKEVAAGDAHSMALRASDEIYAWGRDEDGQVGSGKVAPISPWTPVPGRFSSIAAGANYSVAVTHQGKVFWWGAIGSHSTGDSVKPQPIPFAAKATPVSMD